MNLAELARTNPEITVSIRVGDLLDAARAIIAETREELEGTLAAARTDYLIPRLEVVDLLHVDQSTLNRWEKRGYLVPIRRGVKVFYKHSDVEPILNGTNTQKNV